MSTEKSLLLWRPSPSQIKSSHLAKFQTALAAQTGLNFPDYNALHQWTIENISEFWLAVWRYCGVIASSQPEYALDETRAIWEATWFDGAKLNFAENVLRYNDNRLALVAITEDGQRQTITYAELYEQVKAFAAGLRHVGVRSGDRVGGILANTQEAVVAMLASSSLGAVWTCCSPDFGKDGILDRFSQTQPKVLIGCNEYQYNGKVHACLDKIKSVADALPSVTTVIYTRDVDFPDETRAYASYSVSSFSQLSKSPLVFAQLPFDHPLYILYSSGTTGKPKCIVHGAGGTLIQHLKEYVLHYDVDRKDSFFYFTTTGWTMWNILASALLTGCKVVLYDGSPFFPEADRLINLIDEESISVFGVSAKYLSAIEKANLKPRNSHSLESLRMILSTGSPLARESYEYVYRDLKSELCLGSICGGTDIISAFIEATYTLPVYAGQLQCKGLGMAVEIWDDQANPIVEQKGELVCKYAFPSRPIYFWDDDNKQRYRKSYFDRFANVWAQGDFGEQTAEDGFVIYGRSDAVLNPGGVRIGTAEIYRQIEPFDEILDSVCVGQEWQGDVRVILFVVLRDGLKLDDNLNQKIKIEIRRNTTPRHVPAKVIQVTDIPRTISGKNVEIAVRDTIHGRAVKNTESLANPDALQQYVDIPELSQ
ncbi:MAG: acetoacetate--CoA ligase [Zhongshania sp.]|uniref:acetoacetate--CoA ligase n=1 Tax=Zhongshania sp. TaxID=1971902 RepID=UPI00263604AE|nr:acetoacetate--CoA ligase [Zhongshania sp.]MDF1691475.1 acetoacetate--CoA ligase [Zhongshania sp.]